MTNLADYAAKYECAVLQRDDSGILEVRLHTDGGQFFWGEVPHRELPSLFVDIANDFENRVLIITGTGDAFIPSTNRQSFGESFAQERGWDKIYWEAKRLLQCLLDIEIPIIGAINGPVRRHTELLVLSDIVLCADTTVFQDAGHFPRGNVPGDGVFLIWPEIIGINRGRYFLLTNQELSAQDALNLGAVNEILAPADLLPRAWELARDLAAKPTLTLRYTRACLVQRWKRLLLDDLSHGLLLEYAAMARMRLENRLD